MLIWQSGGNSMVGSDVLKVEHLFEILTLPVVCAAHQVLHNLPLLVVRLQAAHRVVGHVRVLNSLLRLALLEVPLLITLLLGYVGGVVLEAIAHAVDAFVDVRFDNCVGSYDTRVPSLVFAGHPRLALLSIWVKLLGMRIHNLYEEVILVNVRVLERIVNRKLNRLSNKQAWFLEEHRLHRRFSSARCIVTLA